MSICSTQTGKHRMTHSPMSGYGASLGEEFTHSWYSAGSAAYIHRYHTDRLHVHDIVWCLRATYRWKGWKWFYPSVTGVICIFVCSFTLIIYLLCDDTN